MSDRVVTFGEVMLRLSAPGNLRFEQAAEFRASFAGAEANVAVSLACLGVPSEFVTRLPANDLGTACFKFLRQHGVQTEHIARGGERLGVFFLETGAAQRGSKVIYDRSHSSFAASTSDDFDWRSVFAGAGWFHWTGITPATGPGPAAAVADAAQAAKDMGLPVSCDLNYRAKLWQWGRDAGDVMPDLVRRCDVVIGNEEDAEKVFNIVMPDIDVQKGQVEAHNYVVVCERLVELFPNLSTVAFTLRGSLGASRNSWSALLWHEGQVYTSPTYDITPIVDRVGGGDAFAAGLIYGLSVAGQGPQWALEFAVAASCLKHSILGDANLVSVAEIEQLAKRERQWPCGPIDQSALLRRLPAGLVPRSPEARMTRFSRLEVLTTIIDLGLVPLFDTEDVDTAERIITACVDGGARVVEFRNRREQSFLPFADLVRRFAGSRPDVIIGVGSVIDAPTAALYLACGANFVVSPVLNPEVARVCNRQKVAYLPGCGSASEISDAEELGVEICKIFPGSELGGPSFVKAVLAPSPWSRLMPTGGVDATEESVTAWIKAGACCLGMGSRLVTKEMESGAGIETLAPTVGKVLEWIKSARVT